MNWTLIVVVVVVRGGGRSVLPEAEAGWREVRAQCQVCPLSVDL